ncbi:MAG: hypothetical protein ILM98_11750 [Kiritimatiellae bacterium]|nr:hypothetical protein [Kiritimatiellia bacterium]
MKSEEVMSEVRKAGMSGKARWWRGNLHTHSFWSDGRAFPEEAIEWYRAHGYNFLGLSDHNVFQDNPDRWIAETGRESYFAEYLSAFPDAETRQTPAGGREARLRTFNELATRFNAPDRFLLLPAFEETRSAEYADGHRSELHMNAVNIPALLPSIAAPDFQRVERDIPLADFLARHAAETAALARSMGRHGLFMLNHPIWTWYDISPEVLVETPDVRFFEVCNNGSPFAPAPGLPDDGFDTDRFWDVVNAFRARRGLPLLYGVGGDDTHVYRGEPHDGMLMPGNAWTLVRAETLSADAIIEAMEAGDFVACEGIEPEDVTFDRSTGTLSVAVAAKAGAARTIRFIVSKRDFSETPVKTLTARPAEKADMPRFERTFRIYDEKIGLVAKTVEGIPGEALCASYTMADDDLYVRARIEEPGEPLCTAALHPQHRFVAWTQPYRR